jgi:hypothetical protein
MTDITPRWLHPGFSRDSVLNYVFKKSINRVDTSLKTAYFQESQSQTNVFLDYLATDLIPQAPPDDFVELSAAEIASVFGILEEEVAEFNTTISGRNVFSVEKSTSMPHILRINNLLLKPVQININGSFNGVSSRSKVNLVSQTIHSSFGNGGYRCVIKRSAGGGELSKNGNDVVSIQHIAYIFDSDNGLLTLHEEDSPKLTPNPIMWSNPPVFSCYVYRGNFGRLGWQIKNNAIILDEQHLLIGKSTVTDSSRILDVAGQAFIDDLTVNAITTYSDERLKTNIVPAPINKSILELNPVHYCYKATPDKTEFGLIAQEVQKVAPDIIKEAEFLSVQYDRLGVYLLPIVKEQQARIEKLESQVEALMKLLMRS